MSTVTAPPASKSGASASTDQAGAIKLNVYSTDDIPLRQRVKYWNEWSSATITRSRIEPADRYSFRGSVKVLDASAYRLANFVSDPAVLAHTSSHIDAHDDHALILHLQLRGESLNVQDGRETLIREGDYTLCDSSRPYGLQFDALNDMLSIRIPHKTFKQRIAAPEALTCVHMTGQSGISRVVSQFIRGCWSQYQNGIDPLLERRLAVNLLDLLATSYAVVYNSTLEESCVVTSRRLLIKQFIEETLRSPELSVPMLAGAFRCSPAYLHKLFSAEEESICEYIMRRRLEEGARVMRDPLLARLRVSDVAFRLGFKSATHFGRAFKEHFGFTPTDYRRTR